MRSVYKKTSLLCGSLVASACVVFAAMGTTESVLPVQYQDSSAKVMKAGSETPDYKFDFNATVFSDGVWYGTRRSNDVHGDIDSYYFILSDKDLSDDSDSPFLPSATYYIFDIYGPAPTDTKNPRPVDGTYKVEAGKGNFTVNPDSRMVVTDGNGRIDHDVRFKSGTLTISTVEEYGKPVMVYDAVLTDEYDETHHVTYKSQFVTFADEAQGVNSPYLEKNLDFIAKSVTASFQELEGDVMKVKLAFYEAEQEEDDPYSYANTCEAFIVAYMPFNIDGITNGTYNISTEYGDAFTMQDGEIMHMASVEWADGSYVQLLGPSKQAYWGCFASGTMKVSGEGDNRVVECDFLTGDVNNETPKDFKVKFTYKGKLNVKKIPTSMLTEDYTLDLSKCETTATCLGDTYKEQALTWKLLFTPKDGGKDGFQTEFISRNKIPSDGIATDTYTAAPNRNLWKGDYLRGERDDNMLVGTWMMADFNDEGIPQLVAPAREGDLNITNHGDGSYTIEFKFNDGLNHFWSGKWTGKFDNTIIDKAGVESMEADQLSYEVIGHKVIFSEIAFIKVFDAQGRLFFKGNTGEVEIPGAGMWFVSANDKTVKVMIK